MVIKSRWTEEEFNLEWTMLGQMGVEHPARRYMGYEYGDHAALLSEAYGDMGAFLRIPKVDC